MPGFSFPQGDNLITFYQDTGQGAVGRLNSWMAWTADPSPMVAPLSTNIIRMDYNDGLVPLGRGGCGTWGPILDGFANGATSGGDNAFFINEGDTSGDGLLNDNGVLVLAPDVVWPTDSAGAPGSLWSNGGVVSVVPAWSYVPGSAAVYFGEITASELLALGANALPPVGSLTVGSGQLGVSPDGSEVWVA